MRTTVYDIRQSRIPNVIGVAVSDVPRLLTYINEAQRRLLKSSGDKGWWGSWAKMVFNVDPDDPYITTPRNVARLTDMAVCREPINIQNEFYEFLGYGCGIQRPLPDCQSACASSACNTMQALDRGTVPTPVDLTAGRRLRIFLTSTADVGKTVFITGTDTNGDALTEIHNAIQVNGKYITLTNPFIDTTYALNTLTGIQKEVTYGPVRIYDLDSSTGDTVLLATLSPGDTTPSYRRYFLAGLPTRCTDCDSATNTVQITAMAKIEHVDARNDSDFLTIGNIDALKAECQAIRLEEMDSQAAQKMAEYKHSVAVRHLNREIIHYLGKEKPAIAFRPFGSDSLSKAGVWRM